MSEQSCSWLQYKVTITWFNAQILIRKVFLPYTTVILLYFSLAEMMCLYTWWKYRELLCAKRDKTNTLLFRTEVKQIIDLFPIVQYQKTIKQQILLLLFFLSSTHQMMELFFEISYRCVPNCAFYLEQRSSSIVYLFISCQCENIDVPMT